MSPNIKDGEYAVFRPNDDVKSGDVVVVSNGWGESLVRRYRIKGKERFLVCDNAEYPPVKVDEQHRILGRVIEVVSRRKRF